MVLRDASGNFSAGTITAALSGNATTATTLATPRNINGVSFNDPPGVVGSVQTVAPRGGLKSATEVELIVQAFSAYFLKGDFAIERSESQSDRLENATPPITVPNDRYISLCQQWAQRQHETWVQDCTNAGWRYGPILSNRNRTHPLMRPWHDLPAKCRTLDLEQPQKLLDMLNSQGAAPWCVRRN